MRRLQMYIQSQEFNHLVNAMLVFNLGVIVMESHLAIFPAWANAQQSLQVLGVCARSTARSSASVQLETVDNTSHTYLGALYQVFVHAGNLGTSLWHVCIWQSRGFVSDV